MPTSLHTSSRLMQISIVMFPYLPSFFIPMVSSDAKLRMLQVSYTGTTLSQLIHFPHLLSFPSFPPPPAPSPHPHPNQNDLSKKSATRSSPSPAPMCHLFATTAYFNPALDPSNPFVFLSFAIGNLFNDAFKLSNVCFFLGPRFGEGEGNGYSYILPGQRPRRIRVYAVYT